MARTCLFARSRAFVLSLRYLFLSSPGENSRPLVRDTRLVVLVRGVKVHKVSDMKDKVSPPTTSESSLLGGRIPECHTLRTREFVASWRPGETISVSLLSPCEWTHSVYLNETPSRPSGVPGDLRVPLIVLICHCPGHRSFPHVPPPHHYRLAPFRPPDSSSRGVSMSSFPTLLPLVSY